MVSTLRRHHAFVAATATRTLAVATFVAAMGRPGAAAATAQSPGSVLPSPLATARAVRPTNETAAVQFQKDGDRLLAAGDLRGAAARFARAAEASPRNPLFRLTLGVALAALGGVDRAETQFRVAQSLAEDDVIAPLLLQGALAEQGRTAAAQTVYLDAVRRFARGGKPGLDASGSIRRLLQATARFPQSAVTHLLLGDAYQVSEQAEPAQRSYARAGLLAPRWGKPYVNLGVLLLGKGQPALAVRAFETALVREPGNAQVRLLKGDAQVQLGQRAAALQTYGTLQNAPARPVAAEANTRLGNTYLQLQRPDDALQSFKRAEALAPGDPKPVAGAAEAQVQAGNFREGAAAYRSALRLSSAGGLLSTRPILYRGLAEAQLSAGNPREALATLGRALAHEPRNAPLWQRLRASAFFALGDTGGASEALRRALDAEADRYPIETLDAVAARGLTETIRTQYEAERAVGGSRVPEVLVALAHLARYAQDAPREIDLREQAARLRGRGIDWFWLAETYERADRAAEARAAYAHALRRNDLPHTARERAAARGRESATPRASTPAGSSGLP